MGSDADYTTAAHRHHHQLASRIAHVHVTSANTNTQHNTITDKRMVHAGFLRAFRSIRQAMYTALYFVTHDDLSGWKIDVCGHSLGSWLLYVERRRCYTYVCIHADTTHIHTPT